MKKALITLFLSQLILSQIITLNNSFDAKIAVSSVWASEHQPETDIQNTVDGNPQTFFNSRLNGLTQFPVILRYDFSNLNVIDYVTILPRQSGDKGLFGQFELWVIKSAQEVFKYGDYNFKKQSKTQKIFFIPSLSSPLRIQFRVHSGEGDEVSCAEIAFFQNITPPTQNLIEVSLGGNSYVTSGNVGRVTDLGFENWSSNQTVFSTYFRINTPGKLNLYLKSTVVSESVVEIRYANNIYKVSLLPRLIQPIGTIQNCTNGYLRIDFQGISKTGSLFAVPSSILLQGQASKNMNSVHKVKTYWARRGPSVHMFYVQPKGKQCEWFYNQLMVPVGYDPVGSFYMANGFREGYFGMQVNSLKQRRIIFSVWSRFKTNDPKNIPEDQRIILVQKGENVRTRDFGNEGSGGQSFFFYNWTTEKTYKFLTRVRPSINNSTQYTSYFLAPDFSDWKLIAKFLRPKTKTYYTSAYSFLENFQPDYGYKTRKLYMNNQWVFTKDKYWIELNQSRFTCDGTSKSKVRTDYTGGSDQNGFYLKNCGFFDENTTPYTYFTRTPKNIPPTISFVE